MESKGEGKKYEKAIRQWQGIKTMASINQSAHEIKKSIRVNEVDDSD